MERCGWAAAGNPKRKALRHVPSAAKATKGWLGRGLGRLERDDVELRLPAAIATIAALPTWPISRLWLKLREPSSFANHVFHQPHGA